MKSPLRASEDALSSMQSTPAQAVMSQAQPEIIRFAAKNEMENSEAETGDVWDVWPYCWVVSGHTTVLERFHSFHTKLNSWLLARHNRRVLVRHRSGLQGWNCEAGARLVE